MTMQRMIGTHGPGYDDESTQDNALPILIISDNEVVKFATMGEDLSPDSRYHRLPCDLPGKLIVPTLVVPANLIRRYVADLLD